MLHATRAYYASELSQSYISLDIFSIKLMRKSSDCWILNEKYGESKPEIELGYLYAYFMYVHIRADKIIV